MNRGRRKFLAALAAAVAAPFAVRGGHSDSEPHCNCRHCTISDREWIGPGRSVPAQFTSVDVDTMYAAPRNSGPGDGAYSPGAADFVRNYREL